MAKRKRLTPADPDHLAGPLETKAFLDVPASPIPRRAAPIADVAAEAAATAAMDEMAEGWARARRGGRLVVALGLDEIRLDHLTRDRIAQDAEDTESLMQSLRARGQQTPIEVVELPGGGYGLLSGWRRCRALRALHAETGEDRFATVLALLRRPADAQDAYQTMVEENEIRANLSHYERARIVVESTRTGVFDTEKEALKRLFSSVPRARRSKIGSFLPLVHALDGALHFPEGLSERAGLDLSHILRDRPEAGPALRAALERAAPADAMEERAVIDAALAGLDAPKAVPDQSLPGIAVTDPPPLPADDGLLAEWPGLRVLRRSGGRLVLSGPGVDAALEEALLGWLGDRFGG